MKTARAALAFALVVLSCVAVLTGCGGDDEDSAATDTTTETVDTGTDTTGPAGAALAGTVGPGFDISVTQADGASVETLTPGSYQLTVEDLSSAHNFHLTGPGVDVSTDVSGEGTETFTVELEAGTYEFQCDPHATSMRGSFEVS
jgi:plastocyanin